MPFASYPDEIIKSCLLLHKIIALCQSSQLGYIFLLCAFVSVCAPLVTGSLGFLLLDLILIFWTSVLGPCGQVVILLKTVFNIRSLIVYGLLSGHDINLCMALSC